MTIICRCWCANQFQTGEGAFKGVVVLPVREIGEANYFVEAGSILMISNG